MSSATAEERLTSAENLFFEIVGADSRSVLKVDELSQFMVETAQKFFPRDNMNFPQQILVNLRPADHVNFEEEYWLRVELGGLVTLDLRWSDSLKFQTCIKALTEAFFVRYAGFNHGPESVRALPEWPISAISTLTYLRLRPAVLSDLVRRSDTPIVRDIDKILTSPLETRELSHEGYWLVDTLSEYVSQDALRGLLSRALVCKDISTDLSFLLGEHLDTEAKAPLQSWWLEAFVSPSKRVSEVYETIEVSRAWIEEFANFEIQGESVNLRELWKHRHDETLRGIIQARYDLIRLRISRVNPAYFNAGRSLGALFETLLKDGPIFEYIGNLTEFLSDFEDTKALERVIQQHLQVTTTKKLIDYFASCVWWEGKFG